MEERLKHLKKAMKQHAFNQITFSEQQRKQIQQKINQISEKTEKDILIAILQLLTQEKTGFELHTLLRARGIATFENNEGSLYMLLHHLEQKGQLQVRWTETEGKYYSLTRKGGKLLQTAEKANIGAALQKLLEGWSLHEQL
ncbi:PadR family transcriptional regulator [Bacillus arachidis]|uniref:PadR family transcriptional regulator n=1 Tax=Bacillus arachidis TaxID=2819290 RepID=A0ABS3P012_9BACI|nr:PadR family transcriptional regulator [Bacillus arachidis]MBO1626102.1 PadR family transcriptional regulator [Bacillus arachidis]